VLEKSLQSAEPSQLSTPFGEGQHHPERIRAARNVQMTSPVAGSFACAR
jgi:hypothetical protein